MLDVNLSLNANMANIKVYHGYELIIELTMDADEFFNKHTNLLKTLATCSFVNGQYADKETIKRNIEATLGI